MIRELKLNELQACFVRTEFERKIVEFPFRFERTHFVAEGEGEGPSGRIAASVSLRDPTTGYVGFFECDPSRPGAEATALSLIESAGRWLRDRGVQMVHGPVNYHTLFDYRFRLSDPPGSEEQPAFFWEPSQPRCYVDWFKLGGFSLVEEYHSRCYRHLDRILPKSQDRFDQALAKGFSVRPLDFEHHRNRDLLALTRINAGSFEQSFLAEPFDERAYQELIAPRFAALLSEFSFFILNPTGEEIGYFFLFPESGHLVWKTLAILPEYQGAGLAAFGIHHALTLASGHGIQKVVSALIRNGAQSEHLLKRGESFQIWEHRYGVFSKNLK
jgi:GNAT superfamily N-acetyltransferase